MGTGGRVAAAVAVGYLLGRTRKLKLAITVGGLMAGKRIASSPGGLARQAGELVESNPQLAQLSDQVKSNLVQAGRNAAVSVASHQLDSVSESLRERSDRWRGGSSQETDEESSEPENEEPPKREERPKKSAGKSTSKRPASKSRSASKSSSESAKKPTKKSASKRPASKSTSRPAKKSAKKAPARRSSSTRKRSTATRS